MLTDFGLSERVVDAVSSRAGTPHHMAPEVRSVCARVCVHDTLSPLCVHTDVCAHRV
jgi:hypothetical protein